MIFESDRDVSDMKRKKIENLSAEMRRVRGPNDISLCRGTDSRGVEAEFALFTDIPIHDIQQGHMMIAMFVRTVLPPNE